MNVPILAQRGSGNVTLSLRRNDVAPPIPYELQNVYSSETWSSRVQAATTVAKRWSRPLTERIYFFCALITQFAVPMIISNLVLTSIYATGQDGRIPPERFFQFRAVGMGIFLGVFLLLWTPLIAWKVLGNRRLRALEREWLGIDRATSRGGFIPKWRLGKPGIFSSATTIHVTVPNVAVVLTNFHPNAPLPPYINPAATQAPPYDYGYSIDEKTAFGPGRV